MNAKMKQVYEKMVKKRGLRRTGLKIYYYNICSMSAPEENSFVFSPPSMFPQDEVRAGKNRT